jgi:phospholipase C
MTPRRYTRRHALRSAAGVAGAIALGSADPRLGRALGAQRSPALRGPDSLPDPTRPAGAPTAALPFDHIVLVMQENHSFDNYFGMLPRRGQPLADGFTFDRRGVPLNANPYRGGIARVLRAPSECQPIDVNQSWDFTHEEIDHGRMDGFARTVSGQMYYYDQPDIPFYYSLANTFTLANRWFCSAPCQTFPNRRFYLCGTAFGLISTDLTSVFQSPPNGTIVDRLNHYGISWADYFVDVPATGTIAEIPEKNPAHMKPIAQFFSDCAVGTLPSVAWVSSEIGALNDLGSDLAGAIPIGNGVANYTAAQDQDEENPADIQQGESFVESVVRAVLASPAWPRTLLIWLYDEHGGYYDHVPPPAAIAPDNIKPRLGPHDYPGGYDIYGPRVPAVVASPYSKPHGVSNTVCDHTSILATIEAKWNLPACTLRDANANTVASFLAPGPPALLHPPALASSGDLTEGERHCETGNPTLKVLPAPHGRLDLTWLGRSRRLQGLVAELSLASGSATGVVLELREGRRVLARADVGSLGTHRVRAVLHELNHHRGHLVATGRYTLVVLDAHGVLLRRTVRVPR